MAAYDNVTLPGPPSAQQWAPSPIDFSALARIPQDIEQGQQRGVAQNMRNLYRDGNYPKAADGSLDYNKMAGDALRAGGMQAAQPFIQMAMTMQTKQGNARALTSPPEEGAPAPAGSQSSQGSEPPPNSVRGMVRASVSPQDEDRFVTAFSGSLKVDPNAPLTDDQIATLRGRLPQMRREAQNAPQEQPARDQGDHPNIFVPKDQPPPEPVQQPTQAPVADRYQKAIQVLQQERDRVAAQTQYGVQTPETVKPLNDKIAAIDKRIEQYQAAALKEQEVPDAVKTARLTGQGNDVAASEGAIEYGKEDAKRFVKMQGEISTGNKEAQTERPKLALIKSIMADPQFYSGAGAGIVQKYRQWTVALGGKPDAANPQEAFGKAVQDLALSQIRAMAGTGPVRVAEMRIIQQAIANKDYTPATNRMLIEIADRNYARNQQIATMAQQYSSKTGPGKGRIDGGFEQAVVDHDTKNPLFSPAELNDTRIIAPQRFRTPAEADAAGLPAGTPYSDMTGQHLKMTR
jgi:hypothetical protein